MANDRYIQEALLSRVGEDNKVDFYLFPKYCKGCGLCISKCPTKVLQFSENLGLYGTPVVEPQEQGKLCTGCGICQRFCPDCAIKVVK